MSSDFFRVCADINLSNIRTNIINIQKGLKKGTKTCCVIKADGYGHGAAPIAEAADDLADFFAVATLPEALDLRKHNVTKPILILGYVHPDGYESAINNNIRLTVFDYESAALADKAAACVGKKANLHIKLDTGMSRIGFFPDDEAVKEIIKISELRHINIEGIFTHLFAADSKDKSSANEQIDKFTAFVKKLNEKGLKIPVCHCSNSAAAISMPDANFDMVRLGIAQYGLYPSDDVHEITLYPALSLKSHLVMVKTIPKGCSVGYGATYKAVRDMKIGTVPVGYADGYFRTLSNKGYVLINGQYAKITGRICMDQFMVDVSDIPDAKRSDEVILIGESEGRSITMEELSALAGSFNYEFACDIGKRVPRRYFLDGAYIGSKYYFLDKY